MDKFIWIFIALTVKIIDKIALNDKFTVWNDKFTIWNEKYLHKTIQLLFSVVLEFKNDTKQ